MLRFLAPMTQLNSKLERLLSQRSFSTLRKLCNLCDRRPRLRVCPQLFDIRFGVFAAHRLLHLGRLLFCFFRQLLFPEFVSELTTTNALRRNLHQTCVSPLSCPTLFRPHPLLIFGPILEMRANLAGQIRHSAEVFLRLNIAPPPSFGPRRSQCGSTPKKSRARRTTIYVRRRPYSKDEPSRYPQRAAV
jgi:hypothetical protein